MAIVVVVVVVNGIATIGGVLNWTVGLLHALLFAGLCLSFLLMATFSSAGAVRSIMVDFFHSVISRKHLREVGLAVLLIVLVAATVIVFAKIRG